jgi:hypothetical protein
MKTRSLISPLTLKTLTAKGDAMKAAKKAADTKPVKTR